MSERGGDGVGVGLSREGVQGGEAEADLVAFATGAVEREVPAVCAAVVDVAGAGGGQGFAQPQGRVGPGPWRGSSERDELRLGVATALFLAADLLRSAFVEDGAGRRAGA